MAIQYCEYCDRPFKARKGAKTCSNACRVAKHKKEQRAKHFTVAGLTPHHRVVLETFRQLSNVLAGQVESKLRLEGASEAEKMLDLMLSVWTNVEFNGHYGRKHFADMCNNPDFVAGATHDRPNGYHAIQQSLFEESV